MLYKELRKALLDNDMTSINLCEIINRSAGYVSNCMSGKSTLKIKEAYQILTELELPHEDFYKYFPDY